MSYRHAEYRDGRASNKISRLPGAICLFLFLAVLLSVMWPLAWKYVPLIQR